MVNLLRIDKSEGGRGALTQQNAPTCFLGQRTGECVPVSETPKADLKKSDELVDMHGPTLFSQYLNG